MPSVAPFMPPVSFREAGGYHVLVLSFCLRKKLFLQRKPARVYSNTFVQLRAGQGGTAPLEE